MGRRLEIRWSLILEAAKLPVKNRATHLVYLTNPNEFRISEKFTLNPCDFVRETWRQFWMWKQISVFYFVIASKNIDSIKKSQTLVTGYSALLSNPNPNTLRTKHSHHTIRTSIYLIQVMSQPSPENQIQVACVKYKCFCYCPLVMTRYLLANKKIQPFLHYLLLPIAPKTMKLYLYVCRLAHIHT